MNVEEIFANYFITYCEKFSKTNLKYFKTSDYREGNAQSNPHAIVGNAMDFVLKYKDNSYAIIEEYNLLFKDMLTNWPYRAGIDNTYGNIHIHLDLGLNKPVNQTLPFFFKEDDGRFKYQIINEDQV